MDSQESKDHHLDLLEQSRESMNIQKMHPDKVPILVVKSPKSRLQDIENNKLLISKNFKVHRLLALIRNKIHLQKEESLYLFANDNLLQVGQTIGEVHQKYKRQDGFLQLQYYQYQTFG